MRDTILTLDDQRQAWLLLTAYFSLRDLNKKNLYIKLTAVLILLIVGILGIYTAFVQKIATGQCFNILDDSRERMGQMIVNEMQNEQDHLEAASYLMKNLLTDYDANEEMVLQIMRASSADRS